MAAVVGALRAVLSLESAAFQNGLNAAQKAMGDFDKRMKRVGAGIAKAGAAVSVVGAGIAAAIKGQLNYADEMSKAAAKFGVPIEQLSRLKYAADLSDVSMESLGTSLSILSKKMVAAGAGGKAAEVFADLGISVRDATGNMRSTEVVLGEVADRIAAMPDGAEKTALAMRVFGKAGAELIPLLAGGSAGLREMAAEADAMGLVIDEKTGKAAEGFNDNLTRLKSVMAGVATQIMAALAPALESLSAWVVDAAKAFQNLSPQTQQFLAVAATVAVALGPALVALGAVVSSLGTVAIAIRAVGAVLLANPIAVAVAAIGLAVVVIYENWDGISAWFSAKWAMVQQVFATAWTNIKQAATDAVVAFKGVWVGIGDYFSFVMLQAKQGLVDGWERIKALAGEWVASFLQIGRDIVEGLKQGIMERWDAMVSWFKEQADALTADFKSWFGIQSPSRVFRQIGAWLTEGLGLGISDNTPMVEGAMTSVAGKVSGIADSMSDMAGSFKSAWGNAFTSFITGASSAGEAVGQLLGRLADMLANQAFDALWGGLDGKGGIGGWLTDLFGFAKGGAFSGGKLMPFAMGGAFAGGRVQAFAKGGVVSSATPFKMSGGLGVMGEAGPEAIMPLTRGAGGKLGVVANGGGGVRVEIVENEMFAARVQSVSEGVAVNVTRAGIEHYDRQELPARMQQISSDPRRVG